MLKPPLLKASRVEQIFVISSFVFTALLVFYRVRDPDFFWHLANGRAMLEQGRIINEELFSYTRQGVPFSNHEWLAQVLFYAIFKTWGLPGIVAFKTAIVIAIAFLIYKTARFSGAGPLFSALLQVVVIFTGFGRYGERPEIFSLLFFSLTGFLLFGFRNKKLSGRYFFLIPVIFVLWDFLHGAVYGLLLLSAFTIGETLREILRNRRLKEKDYAYCKTLWAVLAATLAAMAINPYGLRTYGTFLAFFKPNMMVSNISELKPPILRLFPFYFALLSVTAALAAIFIKRTDITQLFILVPLAGLSLRYARITVFFELATVPALVYYGSLVSERIKGETAREWMRRANYMALLAAFAFICWLKLTVGSMSIGYDLYGPFYPIGSTRFIEASDLEGNMYNPGQFGGYLAYHLYPKRKIFLYNHHQVFGDLPKVTLDRGVLERYGIQYAVLERVFGDSASYPGIFHEEEWAPVFWDDTSMVVVRNSPENRDFLEKNRLRYFKPEILDALNAMESSPKVIPPILNAYESNPEVMPVLTREAGRCLSYYNNYELSYYLGFLLLSPQNPISPDERLAIASAALKYNPSTPTLIAVVKKFQAR